MPNKQVYTTFYYYLPSYLFGLVALYSFNYQGISLYFLPVISFGIIPILELILKPKKTQIHPSHPFLNDMVTILIVPFQLFLTYKFLVLINTETLATYETIGAVSTMGILCGVYGINVAHDLGHRAQKWKQQAAQVLLLSSMYMHFFIEHNRGHHKRVGTLEDPATARKHETIYAFWIRCIKESFVSAFKLEKERLHRSDKHWFTIHNLFLRFLALEILLAVVIMLTFSFYTLLLFLASAAIGILLLESINYVEHYGLFRNKLATGAYERVNETHSWNSDHVLGMYLLFELTRHSHHHENSLTNYQDLESMEKSLQLPTGYPGMIILALIPPLYFKAIHKRMN